MSQSLSFRDDIRGVNDQTPGRGAPLANHGLYGPSSVYVEVQGRELPRAQQFDESLASNSKLIRVPNQFANKLKEKAENFE